MSPKKSLDTILKIKQDGFNRQQVLKKVAHQIPNPLPKNYYPDKSARYKKKLAKKIPLLTKIAGIIVLILILSYPFYSFITDIKSLVADGRYLILLQNNAEQRGAGGFLGSFAVVNFKKGKVKDYYFESNIFKADNKFNGKTPYPMPDFMGQQFKQAKSLTLHDSNYLGDFSASSELVANLFELEYLEPVDGIIAINAGAIADLLLLTGPIRISQDNLTLESSNFFNILQSKIDKEYFQNQENLKVNQPKSVLQNAINPLFARIKTTSYVKLYGFIKKQLQENQIQFWFKDDRRKILAKYGFDGKITEYKGESFFVVNNNIGGLKSSIAIDESLLLKGSAKKATDRTLSITRAHNGGENYYSANVANKNYTTVYLPLGTTIQDVIVGNSKLSTSDFEIKQEYFKTSVGFWLTTYPNETTTATISYTLPKSYLGKILYQKQSGIAGEQVDIIFNNKKYFSQYLKTDRKI